MAEYTHILAAVDLTEESHLVAKRACALRASSGAKLSCLHVIEPLRSRLRRRYPYGLVNYSGTNSGYG